jgi:4-diphosphocytidyl-2-C-methyl-D-erythritol kinase
MRSPGDTPPGAQTAFADAPAKINLSLRIIGKRDDGYHLLDSLVAFCSVGDRIKASIPASGLTLAASGPLAASVPTDDGNLALRAARAVTERFALQGGTALSLHKALPVAAGIGGGSADAAAALKAVCAVWGLTPEPDDLAALALTLGADVPVCLAGRSCRMTGIGEVLTPLPSLPAAGILLVNPGVPCPTPDVFRARSGPFSPPGGSFDPGRDAAALAAALAEEPNDLTEAAIAVCPPVQTVLDQLSALDDALLVRMSGSGATCFALFADEAAARAAARRLNAPDGWWTAAGRLLA